MIRKGNQLIGSRFVRLIAGTFVKWQQDRCIEMGAALAYYALFSFFPLLLVALSVVGFLLGPDTNAFNEALLFFEQTLPTEAFEIVRETMLQLNQSSVGAGIVGFGLLVFTASGIFGALTSSLDVIWKATPAHSENANWLSGLWVVIRRRISGITLVFFTSILLILSLFANIAIKVFLKVLRSFRDQLGFIQINIDEVLFINALQVLTVSIVLMLIIMMLFKVLPATRIKWSDVWLGALITTLLFLGLQQLISNSVIQIGSRFRSYGVIGGVMVLMFWIYLSCQIFFWGSAFTYVYARLFGSRQGTKHPSPKYESVSRSG